MNQTALPSVVSAPDPAALTLSEFEEYAAGWLLDCDIRQLSADTIANRQLVIEKFKWFCEEKRISVVNTMTLRQFMAYVAKGHDQPGGKWNNERLTQQVKPGTVASYHRILRTLFNWIVAEMEAQGRVYIYPMKNVAAPIDRPDEIIPFTDAQIDALLLAASRSAHPRRDTLILLFLLDTGVRISELCSLTFKDVNFTGRTATVEGKGGKTRPVYFGSQTARALGQYLREDPRDDYSPLFLADKGLAAGEGLTRSGITQIIRRLGKAAKIADTRCSAHTVRHTFAVSFLRNGGNQFSLMQLLGHTDVKQTSRYVKIAQADVANQHRQFSPVDRRKKKR